MTDADSEIVQRYPAESGSSDIMEIFGACIVDYGDWTQIFPNSGTTYYQLERMDTFSNGGQVRDA